MSRAHLLFTPIMAKQAKFPNLIHVTWDVPAENEEPYLLAHTDGVQSLEGGSVAIYKLVEVGRVRVSREFVDAKRRRS